MPRTRKVKTGQSQALPLFRPVNPDTVLEVAKRFVADPESVKISDLRDCILSAADWKTLSAEYDAATEAGKVPQGIPYYYNPAWFRMARHLGLNIAHQGKVAVNDKQPSNWPSGVGTWQQGMRINNSTCNHVKDLRRNVRDFDAGKSPFLAEFGRNCWVIGNENIPAYLAFSGSKGDSTYSSGLDVIKRIAFKEQESKLNNLVFSICTHPVVLRMTGDGSRNGGEITAMPYESATAGYIQRDGKTLNYNQIREAVDSGDTSGMKFIPLDEPIIGEAKVSQSQLVQGVRRKMSAKGTVRDGEEETALERFESRKRRKNVKGEQTATGDKIWYNIREVTTRATPNAIFAFGMRHGLTDMVPIRFWGEAADDQRIGFAIGLRSGQALTNEDRKRVRATDEAPEDATPTTPKKRGRPAKLRQAVVAAPEAVETTETAETAVPTVVEVPTEAVQSDIGELTPA